MSALDCTIKVSRRNDPAQDRVGVTFEGKFLPYKRSQCCSGVVRLPGMHRDGGSTRAVRR
ncbi:MAG: hypothetical protein K6U87_10985 [Firmicutes bacterium]|nr:hypothetical protein [Bacillota bacterium]